MCKEDHPGLERAAKWHDAKSEDYKELHELHTQCGRDLLAETALQYASFHEDAAKAIRALMDEEIERLDNALRNLHGVGRVGPVVTTKGDWLTGEMVTTRKD